jgi:hypothetical protein
MADDLVRSIGVGEALTARALISAKIVVPRPVVRALEVFIDPTLSPCRVATGGGG